MARCKSCKEEIEWLYTPEGKRMPVDAKPEKRVVIGANNKALVVDTYMPHFATCPQGKEWSKGGVEAARRS